MGVDLIICPGVGGRVRLVEPGEGPRGGRGHRVHGLRGLAPGRDLAHERQALVELAHPVDQAVGLGVGGGSPNRIFGDRHSVAFARTAEELGEAAVGLEVAPDHHRVVRLERLGHAIHQRTWEPQRIPDLADGRSGPVRHEVADHPGVLGAVAAVDVLDDLLAPLGGEVDVDVRVGRSALVDEPLEQEVVGDRLDPADPERVGHDRAGRAAPALGRDALFLCEAHQVPADQEELGEPGPLDDAELVREPVDDRRGQRVVALSSTGPAQLREVRERRLALRDGEAREAVLLEPEVDRARRGNLAGRGNALRPGAGHAGGRIDGRGRRQGGEVRGRLQIRLRIGPTKGAKRLERPAVEDPGEDVMELAVLGSGVVDVVRDDHRQPKLVGEAHVLGDEPVVVGEEVVGELDVEGPVAARMAPGGDLRPLAVAHQEAPRDLARAAARERDEALGVLLEQRLGEPRHALGPVEIRAGDEPAEAPVARGVASEQHEVRPALPLRDPPQVLLHRRTVTRQAGPFGPGAGRQALGGKRQLQGRGPAAAPRPPPRRDHDAARVGSSRVLELDLDPDDRTHSRRRRSGGKTHHSVEPVVVRDREPGEAQLGRPLDHVLDRRGPVQEREVRVAVELGVGWWHWRPSRSHPGPRGLRTIEQMFYPESRNTFRGDGV